MFKLSRYYSMASLGGIAIIILVLSFFFRQLALETLMEHQTHSNVDLTRSFANSIWTDFDSFVQRSMSWNPEQVKQQPEIEKLLAITKAQMKGMNVVKVKIYNLNGLTVFSTETRQIGKDKSKNKGFMQAKAGKVVSEITFRNEFYAFEGVIADRNLIASYIPIREKNNGPVKAVFEVYTDVTPLVKNMEDTQNKIIIGVVSALTILYLFLFLIIKRADTILTRHEKERKENEEKIRHQAYHDMLTGLPNRDNFNERIEEAVKRVRRHKKTGALMFLDLDRFKLINDSLGHDAGDQLLRVTAKRIQSCLREMDMAFRLSGDEFVVILEDMDKAENAAVIARRILEKMHVPVSLNGYEVIINISIGITCFPGDDDVDVDSIVKQADAAMYSAKETGHNQYEFFTQEMNTLAFERLSMETDLQRALNNNEFILHYQPKFYTDSDELAGVEALLRWQHPEEGMVMPNNFIPSLEDTGLIYEVGEWVMLTACQQAQKWINAGHQPVHMSVNISAKQFRSHNLVMVVGDVLEKSGLDPRYLELELTETMFVENTEHAIEVMQQLKDLGVGLSIDDFGSGYSSLNYLKQFPVDYLKIDRSFIKDLATNEKDASITSAIAALAHNLNLRIVAEGVEDEKQVEFLKKQGCHEMQGFLFSRPISAEKFEKTLLKKYRSIGNV